MPGRIALPKGGSGPGLVLLMEADRDAQAIADIFTAEGYVVLCPEAKIEETGVAAAVAAVRGRGECTGKVGALGFGRGGRLAYLAAADAGVDCAVVYHGSGIEAALDLARRIRCPLVMHFAENDPEVARVKTAFEGCPEIGIYVYPGVGRGFDCSAGAEYDKPAARLANSAPAMWRRQCGRWCPSPTSTTSR
jgi:carboxymethylenebutenolidase